RRRWQGATSRNAAPAGEVSVWGWAGRPTLARRSPGAGGRREQRHAVGGAHSTRRTDVCLETTTAATDQRPYDWRPRGPLDGHGSLVERHRAARKRPVGSLCGAVLRQAAWRIPRGRRATSRQLTSPTSLPIRGAPP